MDAQIKEQFLIVESDPEIRLKIVNQVRKMGHRVVEAANGREALEKHGESPSSMVISDYEMPVLNGAFLADEIKRWDLNCPVVVTSASISDDMFLELLRYPRLTILRKPFTDFSLAEAIACAQKMPATNVVRSSGRLPIEISVYSGTTLLGRSTNISRGGLSVRCLDPSGPKVQLKQQLPINFTINNAQVNLSAELAWKNGRACGFRFIHLSRETRALVQRVLREHLETSLAAGCIPRLHEVDAMND